jgi:hypothetical protein
MNARSSLAAAVVSHDLLPSQVERRSGAQLQAEQRLMLAVLEDAVLTFQRYAGDPGTRARRLCIETAAWFASNDTAGPFSFVSICQALDLDPDYLRRGLRPLFALVPAVAETYRGSVSGGVALRTSPVRDSRNATRSRFSCAESLSALISFDRFGLAMPPRS